MKPLQPLFWHQGLLLQPQHLQIQDMVHHSLLAPILEYALPHFWGVGELAIDQEALTTGTFTVDKGSFLFPDGTYTVLHDNAVLESRSFEQSWQERGEDWSIYLGLRRWNSHGPNAAICEPQEPLTRVATRLVAPVDPEEVPDLHAGGPNAQVKRQRYLLKLFWESEKGELGEYHLIPLARLQQVGEKVQLDPGFVPPCVALRGSGRLWSLARELRELFAAQNHQLEGYKKQRGAQCPELTPRDLVYLLMLEAMNRHLPELNRIAQSGLTHPAALYRALQQLVAELSTFSDRISASGAIEEGSPLPGYDHHHPAACFAAARDVVLQLLDEISAGPDFVVELKFDGTYYGCELRPLLFDLDNNFYLALHSEMDPKLLLPSLETSAKLSTIEHLPHLTTRALPGIALTYLPSPPPPLPRRKHTIYFALDQFSEQWAMVMKAHNLALHWVEAPSDLELELMVVHRPR